MKAKRRYVAVAGTIGAGKTSLTAWLVKSYGFRPFYEPNDKNPYLADFYADMKTYALRSQLFFLAHKTKLHQELDRAASTEPVVIDRTIYEDAEIFAKNLHRQRILDDRDFSVYYTLYESIRESLRPPDLPIALTCSLKATKRRIASRGREMEAAIPDAYLRRLHRLYEEWFASYTLSPVVRIDTTDLDYVENLVDLIELRARVDEALSS